jgi:hypothetical protein
MAAERKQPCIGSVADQRQQRHSQHRRNQSEFHGRAPSDLPTRTYSQTHDWLTVLLRPRVRCELRRLASHDCGPAEQHYSDHALLSACVLFAI